MKILYAFQGTGNGHLSRAREILPELKKYGKIDILVSGRNNEIALPFPIRYKLNGLGFAFGKKGGIDFWSSYNEASILQLFRDIESIPVKNYDLVINDFEPITAWACQLRHVPCIGMSHQASLLYSQVPTPTENSVIGKFILRNYAPAHSNVCFHFQAYHPDIFTPVIRYDLQKKCISDHTLHVVYLPAYDDLFIARLLQRFKRIKWLIFSKKGQTINFNNDISIVPVNALHFATALSASNAVLCGAGFETPAEVLFLNKKLAVIPMIGQYEQQCNAAALEQMGILVLPSLKDNVVNEIEYWLADNKIYEVDWPPVINKSLELVFENYEKIKGNLPEHSFFSKPLSMAFKSIKQKRMLLKT